MKPLLRYLLRGFAGFLGGVGITVVVAVVVIAASASALLPSLSGGSAQAASQVGLTTGGGGIAPGTVPAEYVDLYVQAATACPEVSPVLLAAQGRAESGFDPNARSPVGAQGISQFMPATWAAYGEGGDPFNPADAIPAQGRFMCALVDYVESIPGDRTSLILAAYNAGPGAVQRYNGVPPFAETQGYVGRIKSYIVEMTDTRPSAAAVALGAAGGAPGEWFVPAAGRFTSPFGPRWGASHNGSDIAAPLGTEIVAASSGTVTYAGRSNGYGNLIIIDHGGGVFTRYAHMEDEGVLVVPGAVVGGGGLIARMGSFGNSTGSHVHFEVLLGGGTPGDGGKFQNPEPFMEQRGVLLR